MMTIDKQTDAIMTILLMRLSAPIEPNIEDNPKPRNIIRIAHNKVVKLICSLTTITVAEDGFDSAMDII